MFVNCHNINLKIKIGNPRFVIKLGKTLSDFKNEIKFVSLVWQICWVFKQ